MTNPEQTYRLRSYRLTRTGQALRQSNTPVEDRLINRVDLERQMAILGVPAGVQANEVMQMNWGAWEITWAPVGTCPNAWHQGERQGSVSRCPDCPPLTDHAAEGNLTATTVLNEVMQKLGLPARADLQQWSARESDQDTKGVLGASVVVKVPNGPKYRITITEL
jgi:hypothetical protein